MSMKKLVLAGAVVATAFSLAAVMVTLTPRQAAAKPEYAAQTGKACTFCHTAPPALNDQGKKFQANGHKL
jgi:cytochrome c553